MRPVTLRNLSHIRPLLNSFTRLHTCHTLWPIGPHRRCWGKFDYVDGVFRMLRRFLTATAVALVGLFAVVPSASAAPAAPGAPIIVAPVVNVSGSYNVVVQVFVNVTIVNNGGVVIFGGGGFRPRERINIAVSYGTPNGLRSNSALRQASVAAAGTATSADASGFFSVPVHLTQVGTAVLTATGAESGRTASLTVQVQPSEATSTPDTTTVEPPITSPEVAPVAAAGGGDGTGLAYTGVSIAGPLTVGAAALITGLAFLFFGTRLAIRRRHTAAHR